MTQAITTGAAPPAVTPRAAGESTPSRAPAHAASPTAPAKEAAARPVNVAKPADVPVIVPQKTSVNLEEGIKKIEEIVDRMNQEMQAQRRGLSFSYDSSINTHVVTVKSASSGEVIRQIPSEVVVRVAHNIEKLKGLLFEGTY